MYYIRIGRFGCGLKKVLTGSDVVLAPDYAELIPNTQYLLPDEVVLNLLEYQKYSGHIALQSCEAFTPNNWTISQPAKSILIWNTGRIGDTLWTTALIKAIKKRRPEIAISVATNHRQIFFGNRDISCVHVGQLRAEDFEKYDGYIIIEHKFAEKVEVNCYQALFDEAGIPFEYAEAKPYMRLFREDEFNVTAKCAKPDENGEVWESVNHVVIGLHSSSQARNIPVSRLVEFAKTIDAKFPFEHGYRIYGLSSDVRGARMQDAFEGIRSYVPVHALLDIREIAALVRRARCVVAPDSMLVHLAAAFDVPTVALMTTISPKYRTYTYPYCVNVWFHDACRYAQCSWKGDKFIRSLGDSLEIAPCYTPQREFCSCATAMTGSTIFQAYDMSVDRKLKTDAAFSQGEFKELAFL